MSSAFNPNTIDYRESVHSPDFPAPWVLDQPQANALFAAAVPLHYWKSVGGIATEMTPAEKAAVDTANLDASREGKVVATIDQVEAILRASVLVILDELNSHAAKINSMLTAVDNATSLADLKTAYAAIADYPTRTTAQVRAAIRAKLGS